MQWRYAGSDRGISGVLIELSIPCWVSGNVARKLCCSDFLPYIGQNEWINLNPDLRFFILNTKRNTVSNLAKRSWLPSTCTAQGATYSWISTSVCNICTRILAVCQLIIIQIYGTQFNIIYEFVGNLLAINRNFKDMTHSHHPTASPALYLIHPSGSYPP